MTGAMPSMRSKITNELGYDPQESFETGLERTLDWFLANEEWWRPSVGVKALAI